MKTKWLYLPIETEVREFDSKLLIGIEAVNRGYSVVFGNPKMNRLLNILPKGIYFSKDSDGLLYELFKRYRRGGGKVCVHDEEGFVQFSDNDYINTRLDFKTIEEIDLYLCWGNHQKYVIDNFKSKYNRNLRTVSTGHPRIDLLRLQKSSEEQFNRILINTKLSAYNIIDKNKGNNFIKLLQSHNMIKSDEAYNFYKNYISYEEKLFKKYIDLVKSISLEFKDKEIMIRPHPSEEINTWIGIFKNYNNIVIEKSNSVHYWIKKSDLIIHTGCTTGIESTILGKYTIAFTPIEDDKYNIPLPNNISHCILKTEDQIIRDIKKFYSNFKPYTNYNYNNELLKHINIGKYPSYVNILNEIDKIEIDKNELTLMGKTILRMRKIINRNKKWKNRKMKYYTKKSFKNYLDNLIHTNNIHMVDHYIIELDKNLFLLNPIQKK